MTICLYKCLRSAGLQHHYARFTLMGVCRAVQLSTLSMEDYPLLGVSSMVDRTRLFHLIQMIKTLDLKRLAYDDGCVFDFDRGDEGYPALDGSFTPDGVVDRDEVENDEPTENGASVGSPEAFIFSRPPRVCRQLSFSDETLDRCKTLFSSPEDTLHAYSNSDSNDELVHGKQSATPVQLEHHRRNDLCGHQRSNNYKQGVQGFLSNLYNGEHLKTEFTAGISKLNSGSRFASNCKTFPKHKPSHPKVTRKPLNNKPCGHKDRRGLSGKKICDTDSPKLTPVYEVKTTAGYNYGLPRSSPHALKNKKLKGPQISVCVRKRPLTCAECRRGEADVVTTPGGEGVIVHESKETVDLTHYILQHRFYFDQVFGEESSNEEVYRRTAYPLVQHMLRGGKATCFAYGQTGAGKTHTMLGLSPGRPGMYALAARDIFAHLSTTHTHSSLLVYVSFFEIYCGQLHDLLNRRKRLFAREDGQKVVHIADLKNVRVDSVRSLLQVISQGTEERTQGISGVNPHSSRSHALLQIQLRDPNQQIAGRMWFVDLAGSERASDARDPDRQTRMEGAEINQSLLALKECIRSLDKENSHTPFRQSKLTQVLKDSFLGDSLTCMIANISPGHPATEHTLNTLRYADRVKELRGQGGLGGRRRGKTVPSPKQNLSSRSGNAGTPKKQKSGKPSESLGPSRPTTKLHTDGTHFCSTPKNNRGETQARGRKAVTPEHTTVLRGYLGTGDARCPCKRADTREGGRLENERYRNTDSHYVRQNSTKAVPVLVQKTDEEQKEGEVNEGHIAFAERESGFHCTEKDHYQKTRAETEIEWLKPRRQVENSKDTSNEANRKNLRDFNRPDKEKERHLKHYHQQLQQLVPLTPSSVQLSSSSMDPFFSSTTQSSLSSLQQSSCLSVSAHLYCGLGEISDTSTSRVDAGVDHSSAQMPSPSGETYIQKETFTNSSDNNDKDIHNNYLDVSEEWRVSLEGTGASRNKSEKRKLIGTMLPYEPAQHLPASNGKTRCYSPMPSEEQQQHLPLST
ncbi:kinesin-like protein KIF24 [Xenentodon cancila]